MEKALWSVPRTFYKWSSARQHTLDRKNCFTAVGSRPASRRSEFTELVGCVCVRQATPVSGVAQWVRVLLCVTKQLNLFLQNAAEHTSLADARDVIHSETYPHRTEGDGFIPLRL